MAQQALIDRDGSPCPYCHRAMVYEDVKLKPTNDHIRPKSKAYKGLPKKSRPKLPVIIVCSECNFMKSDLSLEEFIASLEAKNKALLEFITLNTERIFAIKYLLKIGLDKE